MDLANNDHHRRARAGLIIMTRLLTTGHRQSRVGFTNQNRRRNR